MYAADTAGSMTEDAARPWFVNGGFETAISRAGPPVRMFRCSFWESAASSAITGATLSPTGGPSETLVQSIATTPGQHYTLSFFASGDPQIRPATR